MAEVVLAAFLILGGGGLICGGLLWVSFLVLPLVGTGTAARAATFGGHLAA